MKSWVSAQREISNVHIRPSMLVIRHAVQEIYDPVRDIRSKEGSWVMFDFDCRFGPRRRRTGNNGPLSPRLKGQRLVLVLFTYAHRYSIFTEYRAAVSALTLSKSSSSLE